MKLCHGCSTVKDLSAFGKQSSAGDGLKTQCRQCRADYVKDYRAKNYQHMKEKSAKWARSNPDKVRNSYYKRAYGIDDQYYQDLLVKQNGKCALCTNTPKDKKRLCVDHDHDTGAVRGLLCLKCNAALGVFGDNLKGINKVIKYLGET